MKLLQWALIESDQGLYEKFGHTADMCMHKRDDHMRTQGEDGICLRIEASGGTSHANTLTLGFRPSGPEVVKVWHLSQWPELRKTVLRKGNWLMSRKISLAFTL